ncbi:MAG: TIGR02281 family clan AA aspartic protease [Pseudohongiella sp.]|nr:TIGR02281 family clan AA aspartic protease [Pseudohongiella sp.]
MTDFNRHRPGQRTGIGMLTASLVLGMLMLTWFFDGMLDRQTNPNSRPTTQMLADGVLELQLQRNRQGHYVISGLINGVPATLLLDTGATDVVIPERLAERANLSPGTAIQAMTANGMVTVYNTRIPELQMGDVRLYDVSASINPAMHGSMVLLGMSALRHIEFSQRGDTLTLRFLPD